MTTQIPYDPGSAQPMPEYPASPPWAEPAPPPVPEPTPRDGTPHTRHGQLMVPYPELMHGAGRPTPPTWLPVALVSLFLALAGGVGAAAVATNYLGFLSGVLVGAAGGGAFGLLGATAAARRAKRAKRDRNPRYPYWLAFGLTLVAAAVPGLYAVSLTAKVVQAQVVEPRAERAVEQSLVHSGRVSTPAGVTVQSAKCTPTAPRRDDGLRGYVCSIDLSSGRTGTLRLLADRKGKWTSITTK
jgi:hypothetical protein